jgi:hypothetical protein
MATRDVVKPVLASSVTRLRSTIWQLLKSGMLTGKSAELVAVSRIWVKACANFDPLDAHAERSRRAGDGRVQPLGGPRLPAGEEADGVGRSVRGAPQEHQHEV